MHRKLGPYAIIVHWSEDILADPVGDLFHLAVRIFLQIQMERDVVVRIPRCYMDMEMEDRLSGDLTVVREKIESFQIERLHERFGHFLGDKHQVRQFAFRHFQKIPVFLFGNDQCMSVMDRHDVYYRDDVVRFIQDLGRDLTVDDLGEYCAHNRMIDCRVEHIQKKRGKKVEKEVGNLKGKISIFPQQKTEITTEYQSTEVPMRKFIVYGMLVISAASLALMGFQCSSAEMTSAKLYINRKEFQNAEAQLQKEVSKNPKNEEAWFLLGQIRFEQKNYKGMKDAFMEAMNVGTKYKKEIDAQTLVTWGRLFNQGVEELNKAGDSTGFDTVIETYKLASYVMPESVANQQNLGLAYYRKGDYDNAIAPLTAAMNKMKSLFAIRILSNIYLVRANEYKSKFTEKNRTNLEEIKNLDQVREKIKAADVKYYIGDPSNVEKETKGKGKAAVVVGETWTYAKYNLIVTIKDEVVASVKYSKPYLAPIDSSDHVKSIAEYSKAIQVLKKGNDDFPEDAEISESLMNAYIGSERNDEARQLLNDRVKKYPNSKYDRYNLGVFLLKDNKFEASVNEFKAVLEIDPSFSSAVYNLAATYVNWGVAEQERLKKAKKDDDKSYQEKYRLAVPFLEKVIADKPNEVPIWELLGQVYANLGELEKANAAYKKADEIRQGKN
jgi:tetratricopeptide (TPR) repeat protein